MIRALGFIRSLPAALPASTRCKLSTVSTSHVVKLSAPLIVQMSQIRYGSSKSSPPSPPPPSPPPPSRSSPPIIKSSNDSSPDTARPNDNSEFISEHHVDPVRAVFPWRHSPAPLPRLLKGTAEYHSQGGYVGPNMPPLNKWIRGALYWNAASMLNIPSYKILLFRRWEEELAADFSWAFQMAVAGLLSNTYRVPIESILSPSMLGDIDGGEDADAKETDERKDTETDTSKQFAVNFEHTVAPPPHPTDITEDAPEPDDDYDDESAPDLEYMLQKQLRTLYKTAHEHTRHNLQIHLQTQPLSAEIVSMFLIPFITRERVEATPALRHSLRNVWVHLEEKEEKLGRRLGLGEAIGEIASELETLAKKQADSQGCVESTIIAQVAIRCNEIFKVTDVELDQVVQGDPLARINDVTHLVRFEMVISASISGGPSTIGSWQITDIDDLLDGNVWYM
mmetsp:Transcript_9927/g.22195  ORF Transcript_9927/g.22195 Transcript_9927/m.22195 type:complete len:452 (-) Transcript_9927:136-1491(-)